MKDAAFAILHEGIIKKITGVVPGTVVLDIDCAYLRELDKTPGDSFLISLKSCKKLVYKDASDKDHTDFQKIIEQCPVMLSSDISVKDILVFCSSGVLQIDCSDVSIYLNNEQEISVDDLEALASKYWDDWKDTKLTTTL